MRFNVLICRSEKLKNGFTILVLSGEAEASAQDLLDKAVSLVTVSYRYMSCHLDCHNITPCLFQSTNVYNHLPGTHQHR